MSFHSNIDLIMDQMVTNITHLGLGYETEPTNPIPVVKRKLPKKEEHVDPDTQITVSLDTRPDRQRPFAQGGAYKVDYLVHVTIISPNDNDQLINLPAYEEWRERIRHLFTQPHIAGLSGVYDVNVLEGEFLNRDALNQLLDYQDLPIQVTVIETIPLV